MLSNFKQDASVLVKQFDPTNKVKYPIKKALYTKNNPSAST